MTLSINRRVIQEALGEYGHANELLVAIEELGELSKTITKFLRKDSDYCRCDILEEMADSMIAIGIIREVFEIDDDELMHIINQKQVRTLCDIFGYDETLAENICTCDDDDDSVLMDFIKTISGEDDEETDS